MATPSHLQKILIFKAAEFMFESSSKRARAGGDEYSADSLCSDKHIGARPLEGGERDSVSSAVKGARETRDLAAAAARPLKVRTREVFLSDDDAAKSDKTHTTKTTCPLLGGTRGVRVQCGGRVTC